MALGGTRVKANSSAHSTASVKTLEERLKVLHEQIEKMLVETPNGFVKQVIGLRQFLLRGLDKVRTEWLWACTAFNTRKLILAMRMLRAEETVTLV